MNSNKKKKKGKEGRKKKESHTKEITKLVNIRNTYIFN